MTGPYVVRDFGALRAALIARRVALGMTTKELADAACLPFFRVRKFERGRIHLDDESLPAFLTALKLELYAVPRLARAA